MQTSSDEEELHRPKPQAAGHRNQPGPDLSLAVGGPECATSDEAEDVPPQGKGPARARGGRGRGRARPAAGRGRMPKLKPPPASMGEGPETSGAFAYGRWAAARLETLGILRNVAARTSSQAVQPLRFGSLCTGLGTDSIAIAAIGRALVDQGQSFSAISVFACESDERKLKSLMARLRDVHHFFKDARELKEPNLQDQKNEARCAAAAC